MARNQTLPAWPDLLLLLLEYFPDVPLSSKRGGGRGFFFFFWVWPIWSTYLAVLEGPLGNSGPIKALWALFWLISHLLSTPHSPQKFPRALRALQVRAFNFNQLFLSILLWETSKFSSKKREIFGVLFKAPLFLDKWYGVATYFLYKKKKKLNTWLNYSLHWLNKKITYLENWKITWLWVLVTNYQIITWLFVLVTFYSK